MPTKYLTRDYILIVWLCFWGHAALAQTPTIEQISTQQGLSQNTVRCILQDRKGFLWFGTINGLNRYDGYRFVVYKSEPGKVNTLSDNRIKELYEDKHGFIWLKTYSNKFSCFDPVTETFLNFPKNNQSADSTYDGFYQTRSGNIWLSSLKNGCVYIVYQNNRWVSKTFLEQNGNPQSLSNNCVNFVYEDSRENIWLCTKNGLSFISKSDIVNKTYVVKNHFESSNAINFLQAVELGNAVYFISKNNGVYSFERISNTFTKSEGINNMNVTGSAMLNQNELLITTTNTGVLNYNCKTHRLTRSYFPIDERPEFFTQIISDKSGGIWLSNATGNIWRIDSITKTVKKIVLIPKEQIKLIDNERFIVYADNKRKVWITSYSGGLYCYNTVDVTMKHYINEPGKSNVLSSNYILSIFIDRSGIVWVGTEHTGINKLSFQENNFLTIYPSPNAALISSNNVRAIVEDRSGTIWVSTKDGKLHFYDSNLNAVSPKSTFLKNAKFSSNVYCFFQDDKGFMWLGTKGDGVYHFDPKQSNPIIQRFLNDTANSNSLSNNQIYDIVQDNKKRIWIGTFGGGLNLVQYDKEGRMVFKHFFNSERNLNQIRCFRLEKNGNIWVGTSYGALVFNPDSLIRNPENSRHFTSQVEKKGTLSSNEIRCIYEDKKGLIWIGTSGGLNKYVPATSKVPEHFEIYSMKHGLSNDIIQGIIEDNDNNLWIGTESGISKYNLKNNSFENYRLSNNILGNFISESVCFRRKTGDVLWGSANGFYAFSPKQFTYGQLNIPVILTNFSISGNPVELNTPGSPLTKSITYTNEITLDNNQHSFSIEFATLSFNDQQRKQYSYILENYESEWNQLVNYNIATYRNLPPGKYTFKVKVSNNINSQDNQVTQLKIIVLPPFWKSKFALVLYSIAILFVFLSIKLVMQRIHKLQSVIELEKQLTDYKVKFFTNISHEFRTPLFLIQGSLESLIESIKLPFSERKHFQVMQRNTNRLLMLIEQLLDFSKVQNKSMKLNLQEVNVVEFLQGIYNSFTDIAAKKHIHYNFTTNLDQNTLYIDQTIVDKIAYNLLSNAFKFTSEHGKIDFDVTIDPDGTLKLVVADNGTGIPHEKQALIFTRFAQIQPSTTGIGLSLTRELALLHKGTIKFESKPGVGSTFMVTLSTNPKLFKSEDFTVNSQASDYQRLPVIDFEEEKAPLIKNLQALNTNKILIIEDNHEIRDYLVDYLGKYFRIEEAENGTEGLSKAIESEPDLIVCDIIMPELDGIQLTQKLKNDFQTSHIPIILLTALASTDYQLRGVEAGADAYITKPFSIKYLLTKIIKLIEQREQLRKRYSSEITFENNAICKTDKDKQFLDKAYKIAEENMTNANFSVDEFARLAGYGRTIFFKKIKGITGHSPNEYMRIVRMKKALELIQTGQFTVSEVSYKVGMTDPFYFSRCFKTQFGVSPSSFLKK